MVEVKNCWDEKAYALHLTIEQAQDLVNSKGLASFLEIVVSPSSVPISDKEFKKEKFCIQGGNWYEYKGEE